MSALQREATVVAAALAPAAQEHLAGKALLLSGAQGLLGKYTVAVLRELNRTVLLRSPLLVVATDVVPSANAEGDGVRFVTADCCCLPTNVARYKRYDYVVHMSGIASPVLYKREPLLTIDVAVEGSKELLEIARQCDAKYLFTSTSEVYGTPPPESIPTPETYIGAIPTMTDRAPYDVSKLLGETLAFAYWRKYGLHAVVVRFFNAFGVGLAESDQRILARLGSAHKAGRPLTVYGNFEQALPTRTYCPAANAVYGMLLALVKGGPAGVYNIGAPHPEITVPELCALAGRALERAPLLWRLEPPPDVYQTEPKRRCPDIRKAERELGYSLVVPLDAGLKSFLEWALATYTGLE